MSEGPRLLDVFVNVRPDPQMLEAVKTAHEALLEDLQKRLSEFNTAVGKDTSGAISKVATAVGKLADSMKKLSADTPVDAIANVNDQTEKYSKTVEKLRDDLADAATVRRLVGGLLHRHDQAVRAGVRTRHDRSRPCRGAQRSTREQQGGLDAHRPSLARRPDAAVRGVTAPVRGPSPPSCCWLRPFHPLWG